MQFEKIQTNDLEYFLAFSCLSPAMSEYTAEYSFYTQ